MAREYGYIYAAVGSHPDAADEVDEAALDRYRQLVRENSKVVAIGEIGLDYHYEDIPRDIQKRAFRAQMELAGELKLPAIVHEREAHEDGMKIVEEFPEVTGVFHCYSGSAEMAKVLVSKGWYVGFTGVLTFKNARRALEGGPGRAPGPGGAGDGLPLYVPGALPRPAERPSAALPHGRGPGGALGGHPGGGPGHYR